MNYIMFFIYGLLFGSFYNVVIYRVPKTESIINPPSRCGKCGSRLKVIDLLPVISYLFLRGRCRFCGEKYSIRYMIVEIMTGVLFVFAYYKYGYTVKMLEAIVLSSLLLIISMIDMDHHLIFDRFVIGIFVVGLLSHVYFSKDLFDALYGFLVGGGFLFIILLIGPMGGGDVKLMAALGVVLGLWKTVMALFFGFILGACVGVVLILLGLKSRKDFVPFGPFLGLGSLIAYYYFYEIAIWYLDFVGL